MNKLDELLEKNRDCSLAIYGLGTETKRFLDEYGKELSVVGLLDGFREDGEIYGYPIISMSDAIGRGVTLIIVVARPGSCKAISKRIGDVCREKDIRLFDVRGNDLLVNQKVSYDFCAVDGRSRKELIEKIDAAKIVSFDLFDTLVMRKVLNYTDVFELVGARLIEKDVFIPDFAKLRLSAEKECSKDNAPTLTEIYEVVLRYSGNCEISAEELADMEWDIDSSLMIPRYEVCDIFRDVVKKGKKVVVTTDCYYSADRLADLLASFGLNDYDHLIISCEKGTSKTLELFDHLAGLNGGETKGILHVGDDEFADIEYAGKYRIETFRIYSGADLFDALGGFGTEKETVTLADRVKTGMLVSRLFNDPFVFEDGDRRLSVDDAADVGYLFSGAMITDFCLWLRERVTDEGIDQLLFCARDGYLINRLYRKIDEKTKSHYFLTSRTAAIRAGMKDESDVAYVSGMKFFGSDEESLRVRYGIEGSEIINEDDRKRMILRRAALLRENYGKYIKRQGMDNGITGMFDFVAKGTTQMYLQRLFVQHIKGFYFLQLEPEFMADKGLDIEPFYSDEEKDSSAIFDSYYILETMLTAPDPQLMEFDSEGNPVFANETRSERDIECFMRAQKGIEEFFDDFTSIVPRSEWRQNKRLDEIFLSLINKIRILDKEFMALTVEDPFFGRMTAITDVIG